MNICRNSIQQTKDRIKKYYQIKQDIAWQLTRLDKLEIKLDEIKKDLENPNLNFNLRTDLQAVNYDTIRVTGGYLPTSSMERGIEDIYRKLECQYLETESEVMQTKILIRELKKRNEVMEYCIGLLGVDYQRVLYKKFVEKKSLLKISFEENMSKSNVSRVLYDIYADLTGLLDNLKIVG